MKKVFLSLMILVILSLSGCVHYSKSKLQDQESKAKVKIEQTQKITIDSIENKTVKGYITNIYTGKYTKNNQVYDFTYNSNEDLFYSSEFVETNKQMIETNIIGNITITDYKIKTEKFSFNDTIKYKNKDGKVIENSYIIKDQILNSSDLTNPNFNIDLSISYNDNIAINATNFNIDLLKAFSSINSISIVNKNEQLVLEPISYIYVDDDEKNLIMSYQEIWDDLTEKDYQKQEGNYYRETYYKLNDYECENITIKYEDILEIIYDENYNIIYDNSLSINPRNNFEVTVSDKNITVIQKEQCPYYIYTNDEDLFNKQPYICEIIKDKEKKTVFSFITKDNSMAVSKDNTTAYLFKDYKLTLFLE